MNRRGFLKAFSAGVTVMAFAAALKGKEYYVQEDVELIISRADQELNVSDILAKTIEQRSAQMAENIAANNAVLKRYQERA